MYFKKAVWGGYTFWRINDGCSLVEQQEEQDYQSV